MKPLDATLRVGSAVAVLVLSGALSGCYYYAPYGYYPGYGYYPAYPPYSTVPTAATLSDVPVSPGDASQPPAQAQFAMPDGSSPEAPPAYDIAPAPAYGAPAYYPVAYPYAYPYPYPYYGYGWPGYWWPSVSFSFAYWGGCCGGHGHYGYWGHHGGYWGGHGYWGGNHGTWGGTHGTWGGSHGTWGGTHAGWGGGGGHYWGGGGGHGHSH